MEKMEFASQDLTAGQLNAIVKKLGGKDGALQFLRGETVVTVPTRVWQTWKTIKLGTGLKTSDDFRKALKSSGLKIGDWASDILGKPAFKAATEETEVELVRVSGAKLGFKNGARQREIYQRAQELGLELCPAEVGPQLRLQYKDQPYGEWLIVAMEPITDSDGDLRVFHVEHGDRERWLLSGCVYPGGVWDGDDRWLFVRRK